MAKIIAHRANGSIYPPNTKEAVREVSTFSYVDGVEIDIRMTKDKKFVLSHSSHVFTHNHHLLKIEQTSSKKLKKETKLSFLEEVCKEYSSEKILVLDLKIENNFNSYITSFKKLLTRYPNNYYVASFHYQACKILKNKEKHLKVGFLKGYGINAFSKKENLDFCLIHYPYYQKEEGVFTVNRRKEFWKYQPKNILLITDYPQFQKNR